MKLGRFILPLLAIAAPIAFADITTAKTAMGEVLQNLGDEQVFTMHKTGTEDYNGNITNLESVLVIRDLDPNPGIFNYRIEYRSYRNGTMVNRAAVDGSRIWFYTVATNAYSVYTYNQIAPANQPTAIFRTLNKLAGGEEQIMMQVAQQAFEASLNGQFAMASKWLPWMPVYSSLNDSSAGVQVESQVPNYRFIDYQTAVLSGENTLVRIKGRTELNRPGRYIINDWNIEITPNEFTGTDYSFVPPANSRASAVNLSQGG